MRFDRIAGEVPHRTGAKIAVGQLEQLLNLPQNALLGDSLDAGMTSVGTSVTWPASPTGKWARASLVVSRLRSAPRVSGGLSRTGYPANPRHFVTGSRSWPWTVRRLQECRHRAGPRGHRGDRPVPCCRTDRPQTLNVCRQRIQQHTCGHRGRTWDPLYGARRILRTRLPLLSAAERP